MVTKGHLVHETMPIEGQVRDQSHLFLKQKTLMFRFEKNNMASLDQYSIFSVSFHLELLPSFLANCPHSFTKRVPYSPYLAPPLLAPPSFLRPKQVEKKAVLGYFVMCLLGILRYLKICSKEGDAN